MRLRKLLPKDAQRMLSWMHDPETKRIFATDFSSFDAQKVAGFIAAAQSDAEALHRACVDDADDYLGTVSLKNIDMLARNAEYAISFCKEARGTGAARYATGEILQIAFEELGLHRVYLNVSATNQRANRFYVKYGFVYEGCFKEHILIDGALCDLNWYRMLKPEYDAADKE